MPVARVQALLKLRSHDQIWGILDHYIPQARAQEDFQKITYINNAEIHGMLGTNAYYSGTLDSGAAHLHPLKFAFGLARAAIKAGVRVFERTEVERIIRTDPAVVSSKKGRVQARFVLVACNGYLGQLD